MRDFDYKGLDLVALQAIVAIFEDLSVSKAAIRLDLTQSTLSHRLEKARGILGDPLFIRKGRGIAPTEFTSTRISDMRTALAVTQSLYQSPVFNPENATGTYTIAATDYERGLFIHDFCCKMLERAPKLTLNLVWDKYDNAEALRRNDFDLALAPFIGQARDADIRSEFLFQDNSACFTDPAVSSAIGSLDEYLRRRHVSVIFSDNDESFVDRTLNKLGKRRDIAIRVPSLSDVPAVLRGTQMIATLPLRSADTLMAGFRASPPPFEYPAITFGMFWHSKTEASPQLNWLREALRTHVKNTLGTK